MTSLLQKKRRALLAGTSALVLCLCFVASGHAADHVTDGREAVASNSHWGRVLTKFTEDGHVDYKRLSEQPRALDLYIAELEAIEPAAFQAQPAAARMALWINAYNAYTIRWILNHYPTEGIRTTVSFWRLALGAPFNIAFIPLGRLAGAEDRLISLSTIEHEILRKSFDEPRIHFAIVCASKSCPPLRGTPYTAAHLESELDENARDFLGDPTKNRYDAARNELTISQIFRWFDEDFESGGGPKGYFQRYGPKADSEALAAALQAPAVAYGDYDWSLND